jgi:hypothetical protein
MKPRGELVVQSPLQLILSALNEKTLTEWNQPDQYSAMQWCRGGPSVGHECTHVHPMIFAKIEVSRSNTWSDPNTNSIY